MITKMTVENFKALRHVEVELAPFTVLIGPNDSGKTSFLEAVYAISESTRSPLANCFWSPWQSRELVHKNDPDSYVKFAVELIAPADNNGQLNTNERILYSLALSFSGDHSCTQSEERIGRSGMPEINLPHRKNHPHTTAWASGQHSGGIPSEIQQQLRPVLQNLPAAALARWDVEELGMPSRLPPNRRYPFDPSGYGLSSCIAEMKLDRTGAFEALRNDFCKQFPVFQDIVIRRATVTGFDRDPHFQKKHGSHGEGYSLVLVRNDNVEIPAGLASGGTLVTLAFLTLVHLPAPRKLLLIEEPENALHPGRLREVMTLLRRAMSSNPDSQVIVTTHSPLLLDYVQPDEVRVFLRDDQDDVKVYNVADVPDIRDRLKYLMLGELIYNEGEEELVKEIEQHAHIPAQ